MVTTISETVRLIAILLRYLSKRNALKMMTDMEEEVGMLTENESLRQSITMARDMLE